MRQGIWTEVSNDSPFAFRGNQWVGYDNVDSVRRKANYIKRQGFGGAMVFSIDMDDFKNTCCTEAFPLTKAIARALGIRTDPQPTPGVNCQRPPSPVTPPPLAITTGFDSGMSTRPTTPSIFPMSKNENSCPAITKIKINSFFCVWNFQFQLHHQLGHLLGHQLNRQLGHQLNRQLDHLLVRQLDHLLARQPNHRHDRQHDHQPNHRHDLQHDHRLSHRLKQIASTVNITPCRAIALLSLDASWAS